jgi:uncharacterized protein YjbI with pentapeptide repeats
MTQNFSGQNLRGRSFKDRKDLIGANFSYADIRGTDFTNAVLVKANFSQAQAGREGNWAIILFIGALLLSTLSGLASAYVGAVISTALLSQNPREILAGVVIAITLILFVVVAIRQGLVQAFAVLAAAATIAVALLAVVGSETQVAATIIATVLAVVIAMVASAAGAGVGSGSAVVVAAASSVIAGMSIAIQVSKTTAAAGTVAAAIAVAVAMSASGLSALASWQALTGDKRYGFLRKLIINLVVLGGTSFRGADLTDADFTQATLESTNLKQAKLTRTCWFQVKKLDLASVSRTYLTHERVRQLVITGEGQHQKFDHLDMRGVNLRGANLTGASFVETDLSEANLQSANLSKARLKQTHLDGADLIGAYLAGAEIEDWGITPKTKFDKIQYEYLVFKQLGQKKPPKP